MQTSSAGLLRRPDRRRFDAASVCYQPVHSLAGGTPVVGCEVLVQPPAQDLIEETHDLTAWVLAQAEADALPVQLLSVNLEPSDLDVPAVLEALHLASSGLSRLIVEVTERGPIPDVAAVRALRATGALVALDDVTPERFWTAVDAEPDLIKLELELWRRHLKTAVGVCRANGIDVVVERIETRADAEFVRRSGVTLAQGFFWSAPMPSTAFRSYMLDHRRTA